MVATQERGTNMSSVPQPYRAVDLIMQGANTLGQGVGDIASAQKAEAQANAPIHPKLQQFIDRMLAGEDPARLGQEAKGDPELQAFMAQLRGGGQAQPPPSAAPPDLRMQPGGQPSLGAVGSMWPGAREPALRDASTTNPDPTQRSLYRPAPGQGGPNATPNAGQSTYGWTPPPQGQAQTPYSLAQMGQPMLGAPTVDPRQAGAAGEGPAPTQAVNYEQGGVQVSRPAAPEFDRSQTAQQPAPAQAPASRPFTNRDFAQISPMLPSMIAGQSRQNVAGTQAGAREAVANLNTHKALLIQTMKQRGATEHETNAAQIALGKMTVDEQIAALKYQQALEVAKIGAGATLGAAGIKADTKEDPDEKRLRNLESRIQALKSKTDWEKQPDLQEMVSEFEAEADAAAQRLGKPRQRTLQPGATQPATRKPAKTPAKGGKIRVKLANGQVGSIDPAQFDPKTMTKL